MDVGLLGSTARPERQSLGLSPCPLGIPLLNSRLPRMRVKAPEGTRDFVVSGPLLSSIATSNTAFHHARELCNHVELPQFEE
jgi:hypothetical protein